jgi:hypothetical protein
MSLTLTGCCLVRMLHSCCNVAAAAPDPPSLLRPEPPRRLSEPVRRLSSAVRHRRCTRSDASAARTSAASLHSSGGLHHLASWAPRGWRSSRRGVRSPDRRVDRSTSSQTPNKGLVLIFWRTHNLSYAGGRQSHLLSLAWLPPATRRLPQTRPCRTRIRDVRPLQLPPEAAARGLPARRVARSETP